MKNISSGDTSDDEVIESIEDLAFRMGREPYTFYDADGDPWAVLVRADDYAALEEKAEELDLLRAFMSPSTENTAALDQV